MIHPVQPRVDCRPVRVVRSQARPDPLAPYAESARGEMPCIVPLSDGRAKLMLTPEVSGGIAGSGEVLVPALRMLQGRSEGFRP